MRDTRQATTATNIPAPSGLKAGRSRLLQRAPGPESPDSRDKAGAKRGMVILLIGGGVFWLAVAAAAVALFR